ncbi:MAG: hypothetical protein GM45_4465 [actinobacterium acAMD-5]|jgi:hypothetical protein|nr:MAG: hypothetical protein GM45_4465 [actinobacterium acAMD-5]
MIKSWVLAVLLFVVGSVVPYPPAGDGTILRSFERPLTQFSAGHRGVDLQADPGELVISPVSGEVWFSGYVVDRPVITIATKTILLTIEPVYSNLVKGDLVKRSDVIGVVDIGGDCAYRCIHVGVRIKGTRHYLDPIPYLLNLPKLLPIKP